MLGAMVLVGLVAAVATPALVLMSDGVGEEDDDVGEVESTSDLALLNDEAALFEVDPGDGELVLSDFVPGQDILSLQVPSLDTEIEALVRAGGGWRASFGDSDTGASVIFPHLDDLPTGDIEIVVVSDDGAEIIIPFDAMVEQPEDEQEEETALDPLQPVAAADTGHEGEDLLGAPLSAADDAGDESGGGIVIAPVLGPVEEELPDGADGTLDAHDPQAAGDGEPTVHLILAGHGGDNVDVIEGFEPGLDTLRVAIPDPYAGEWEAISVQADPNGANAVVTMSTQVIAVLKGSVGANAGDIEVVVRPDLFT